MSKSTALPALSSLSCEALCKVYADGALNVPVLNNVNLSVSSGELVAIIGTSGSGKTTLLQLLGGLDAPTSGRVFVGSEEITTLSEKQKGLLRNRSLGFIYQFHHLLPEFNALENVCMPLLIRGEKVKIAREKAQVLIEKVGLAKRQQHRVGELSGGERQRIAIARALVTEPHCVLADEPTGNLDAKTSMLIVELMLSLNEQLGTSFVVVTHNQALAETMQRTLVLERGTLS